ncbi:acyl-[acyl-carrier-protein] thioesterase [Fibrella sp. HMF5335]|uniref:Acyl-[acyl-carrier-protein] thioesterase n=1 Tax=Fibrella rubiginis TaxID=2817060 RepID=A0A939K4Y5_9BACT|nr:acyl-ACP thioesterase domain-containing protein [Fibrella rubiginis]MBO0937193.1 acyl-[acyl-carrier-protein] thioesterase [Fibrella rubiginis]
MLLIQTDTYTLRGYECDAFGRLSVPALMNLMQESASLNAVEYGIGIGDLQVRGYGWMLMRFQLRMHQYPRFGDTIQVSTYPTAVEKYFIYRDFQVTAQDGTLLAEATSTWLVFSTEKRAMAPLPDFIRQIPLPPAIGPMPKLPLKPTFQTQPFTPTQEQTVQVGWFSIDQNQHVNNVTYIQWVLEQLGDDSTGHNALETSELVEIDVVYKAETHWGDRLRVQAAPDSTGAFLHRIIDVESGKDVLLARSVWGLV